MSENLAIDFDVVRDSAKRDALPRYYAALFAPAGVRDDLIAVAAFTGAIERVGREVGDATLAEIRLIWWRDALSSPDARSGNPVLDAFADVAKRHAFDSNVIERYLDAHASVLFPEPQSDEMLFVIGGTPFAFAAKILGVEIDDDARAIIDDAGRAAAITRIALDLPYALTHGRAVFPLAVSSVGDGDTAADWRPQLERLASDVRAALASVRDELTGKSRKLTTALLPLALIEPQFRALLKEGHEPARDIVEIAPLVGLWRIAYAHWTGRL